MKRILLNDRIRIDFASHEIIERVGETQLAEVEIALIEITPASQVIMLVNSLFASTRRVEQLVLLCSDDYLHDEVDALLEDRNLTDVVTTDFSEELECFEYFLFGALLTARGDGVVVYEDFGLCLRFLDFLRINSVEFEIVDGFGQHVVEV